MVARICCNCFDWRFDGFLRAFDYLEEALIPISEKARKAPVSIIKTRLPQQFQKFSISHRLCDSTPVREGDHSLHGQQFGTMGVF